MSFTTASTASPTPCITAVPGKNDHVPLDDCRALWLYSPSFSAAVLFSVIFGISTLAHIVQAFIHRKKFCWVIIIAAIWETVGFCLRVLSSSHQLRLAFYLPEELLILLAPIWINAFVYMILGRMVHYFLPEKKVLGISAPKLARCFVCMDIVAFIVQAVGGNMMSAGNGSSTQVVKLGLHIYMGGIGLQEFFILIFSCAAITFHLRILSLEKQGVLEKLNWRPLLYALYASLMLITVRIIFRLVQYSSGFFSTIPTHEGYFYGFEAVPMAIALWLLNIIHPGCFMVGPESEFPRKTREKKEEAKRQKREAKKAKEEAKEAKKQMGRQRGTDDGFEDGRNGLGNPNDPCEKRVWPGETQV